MTFQLIAILVAGAIGIVLLVIRRIAAARRDERRIREGLAAIEAPPPPPTALLELGYGTPRKWGVVTDEGALLSLHDSRLVMMSRGKVVLSIPFAEIVSVAAPRSLNPPTRNRYGQDVHEGPLMGDSFDLVITRASGEPVTLPIHGASEWADAISAALRGTLPAK